MKIIDSKQALKNIQKGWALTIGNFDGVHLGHQEILRTAEQAAKKFATPGLAVMTFHPHPAAILYPDRAPGILTPLKLKTKLLEKYGVDCLIVIKDTFDLLNLSPEDFVKQFLLKTVKPAVVIEGPNFNFGYGRSGNIETLRSLSQQNNFEVIVAPAKHVNLEGDRRSVICSSSMIRDLLETGRIADAKTANITKAFTNECCRNRGIATALLNHVLDWARSKDYERCAVGFEPQNISASRFWLKYFQPVCCSMIRHVDERIAQVTQTPIIIPHHNPKRSN